MAVHRSPIRPVLLLGALILSACAGMQKGPEDRTRPQDAYATLQGEDAVAALGKDASWPAGKGMTYISVSPDGRLVLATASAENRVYAYRAGTGTQVATIPVGKSPKGVKIDPGGEFALVANEASGSVSVIDLEELEAVKEIPVGPTPHNSVFSPKGARAYVIDTPGTSAHTAFTPLACSDGTSWYVEPAWQAGAITGWVVDVSRP